MIIKLKPCPFCGRRDMSVERRRSIITLEDDHSIVTRYHMIRCRCGASMMVAMQDEDEDDGLPTAKEAAWIASERWNRRRIE